MNPSLSVRVVLLPLVLTCGLANLLAQTDVEKPADSIPLEKVPERLTQLDEEWKKKTDEVRTLVDAEEVAKRISEATAQSLRFSLRTAGNVNLDVRNVASNARIPADNATLSKAFRDLDAIASRQLSERTVLVENAVKEVRDRVSKLLVEAKDPAEIEGFIATIDVLKSALSRRTVSSPTDFQGRLSAASSILGQLRRLVEAQASGNLTQLSQAVAEFRNNNYPDRELVLESDRRKRIDSIIKPYQKAEEESLAAMEAAMAARKPAAEVSLAFAKYAEAAEAMQILRGYDGRQQKDLVPYYRSLTELWKAMDTGDSQNMKSRAMEARNALQNLGTAASAKIAPIFAKIEEDAMNREQAAGEAAIADLRKKISGAKNPADVEAIITELRNPKPGLRSNEIDRTSSLLSALTAISSAWRSNSVSFMQNFDANFASGTLSFAPELNALRARVERGVIAQSMDLPALLQPPLADKPTSEAIETICDQLVEKREWRPLLRLLESRAGLANIDGRYYGRGVMDENVSAIRAFLVAQNFELAELWREAADSYRTVLRSTGKRAPIAEAAERLKTLTKEHPEAATPTTPPVPSPVPVRQ